MPCQWPGYSIKLAGYFIVPASHSKVWLYKANQISQFSCFSFPDRSEMTQQDVKMRSFSQTLPRGSSRGHTIVIFAKYCNLTSTLGLVHGIRNVCCFWSLQRSKLQISFSVLSTFVLAVNAVTHLEWAILLDKFSPSRLSSEKTKLRPGYTSSPLCCCHTTGWSLSSPAPPGVGQRKTLATRLGKLERPSA